MGFQSISYQQLSDWRIGKKALPERPIMFDFDHAVRSIKKEIHPLMEEFGFHGNLFINTEPMEKLYAGGLPLPEKRGMMTWEEIGEIMASGWHIGAHTHNHTDLSELSTRDPSGEAVRAELIQCDEMLHGKLGITPRDFAFTGTSWSSAAEREVMKRYRFGRLWIVGSVYRADRKEIRYAELVGASGQDEPDGGPPASARYITRDSHPYRLPSMELHYLIYDFDAYRRYLEGALR